MIELGIGSLITLISLLIGFNLGRYEKPLPPQVQRQLAEIFKKKIDPLVNESGVGAVSRPTQEMIDRWKNPQLAVEEEVMEEELDRLNKQ